LAFFRSDRTATGFASPCRPAPGGLRGHRLTLTRHDELFAPRDAGVNEVALQQQVLLHRQRREDCGEFGSLRLVDRDAVGQRDLVEFAEIVKNLALIEPDRHLAVNEINLHDLADVAVEHVLDATLCFKDNRGQPFTSDFIPRCASLPHS